MRGASGWWISGALAALFVFMLADAGIRSEWSTILLAAPWMAALLILCWALLIRPCLVVSPEGLTIVNVLRTHTLPWGEIAGLQVRYQLIVTRTHGAMVRAWGSPTVHPRRNQETDGSPLPAGRRFVGVVEAIEQAREELGPPEHPRTESATTFAWTPVLAFCIAVALGILSANLLG